MGILDFFRKRGGAEVRAASSPPREPDPIQMEIADTPEKFRPMAEELVPSLVELLRQLSALSDQAYQQVGDLDQALTDPRTKSPNILTTATYYKDIIIPRMESLRAVVDQAEQNMPAARWPFPSYAELMFRV